MKRILLLLIGMAGLVFTSCGSETLCASYGGGKKTTKHGTKAQARYARHARKNV